MAAFCASLFSCFRPKRQIKVSDSMRSILKTLEPNSLLILDIDFTIAKVGQIIGLDSWFKDRLAQFEKSGASSEHALSQTLNIYNQVQKCSTLYSVESGFDWKSELKVLRQKNVKVIALTARNDELVDTTITQLEAMGVTFCRDVIKATDFYYHERLVRVKDGVVFANGQSKGEILTHFQKSINTFKQVTFVDDGYHHAQSVFHALTSCGVSNAQAWHYSFASKHFPYNMHARHIATHQEQTFLKYNALLSDEEARQALEGTSSGLSKG
jgi:hypothetical protein